MARKAFTLIELLVVIAIIALLLSVLMPALQKVKQQAATVVCLSNIRGMTEAWHVYLADNNDKMVSAHVPNGNTNRDTGVGYWIESPQDDDGNYNTDPATVTEEEEINGIRKGALFPYLNDIKAYHCPADKSDKIYGFDGSWRNCYSINGLMNGRIINEQDLKKMVVKKGSEIVNASNKIVFMENMDGRGWLMGSWLFGQGSDPHWMDIVGIRHGNRNAIGFADGHAENRKWVDGSTIENAEAGKIIYDRAKADESGDDLLYVNSGIKPGR